MKFRFCRGILHISGQELLSMAFRCGQKHIDDKNTLKNIKRKSTIVKCIKVYKKTVEVKKTNESDKK